MSYDQHACNIIHVKISRYIEKEHKDHYHYIFNKKKRKKKKHNSHFNENPSIVEINNGQERHTVPTKSTFNHQYYIQNFQFSYSSISNPEFYSYYKD